MTLGREACLFGLIGGVGFFVDGGILLLGHDWLGLDWPLARLISFSAAATVTWALNRRMTFRYRAGPATLEEWRRYLAVNGAGAMLNFGVFLLLMQLVPIFRTQPLAALAIAAGAALAFNFLGSRALVFRFTSTSSASTHDD